MAHSCFTFGHASRILDDMSEKYHTAAMDQQPQTDEHHGEPMSMPLRAILIDDENSSLRSLSYELKAYCPEVEVIAQFQDPRKALAQIGDLKPDVIFLDIEMPGMNGFDFLQRIEQITFDVIFVTAYDQFAVRAFDFNALDYVLKPVRKAKLIQAVQKVSDKQRNGFDPADLQALMQNIRVQTNPGGMETIALPTSEGFSMVNVSEIIYLEAESNYTWVYLQNKQKHLVSRTLKEFVGMLDFPHFFRPHKSYLVNLNYLDRYVRGRGGYMVLKTGQHIPVARAQKAELFRVLNIG